MANIVILGAGMMGTAFAWPLSARGHDVRLVGTHLDQALIDSVKTSRLHPKLNLRVPDAVRAFDFSELPAALAGADAIVLGVSSAGVRWAAAELGRQLSRPLPLAMVSKGLDFDGQRFRVLPELFSDELPASLRRELTPVGIAGPCIAGELARSVETCVVFCARSLPAAAAFAELCRAPFYHVWTSEDVTGVEVCAALKNAYAMGIALAAGMHRKTGAQPGSIALHNIEAAVFAQSIWEMQRLLRLLGSAPEQASWLPGVGDLDVTCNGGRTGRFGQLLGEGLGPEEAQRRMQGATLECLEILSVLRRALPRYVERGELEPGALPLAEHLFDIALDGKGVRLPLERFFQGSTLKRSE